MAVSHGFRIGGYWTQTHNPLSFANSKHWTSQPGFFMYLKKFFCHLVQFGFFHSSSIGLKSPSSVTVTATRRSTEPDFFDRWLKKISDAGHYFFSSFCCFSCLLASIIVDDNPRSWFNCFVNGRISNKMEWSAG